MVEAAISKLSDVTFWTEATRSVTIVESGAVFESRGWETWDLVAWSVATGSALASWAPYKSWPSSLENSSIIV